MEPERYYLLVKTGRLRTECVYFVPEDEFEESCEVTHPGRNVVVKSPLLDLLYSYEMDEARSSVRSGKANLHILGIYYVE